MNAITLHCHEFQSTLPRGERLQSMSGMRGRYLVSIHAPARGATWRATLACAGSDVSIHAPARGATCWLDRPDRFIRVFQSTLPRGERHRARSIAAWIQSRFNPRSRAGSDHEHVTGHGTVHGVSIHAPARGATTAGVGAMPLSTMFQSTLPRGERPAVCRTDRPATAGFNPRSRAGSDGIESLTCQRLTMFQSTLPRGERHRIGYSSTRLSTVSIHAPARGATASIVITSAQHACFNPRSRAGSDHIDVVHRAVHAEFQSTLPRGERRAASCTVIVASACFNPRSRAGSDRMLCRNRFIAVHVSIHAPARGATSCVAGMTDC